MSAYLVLARKWRPQSFDSLVGQEHVTRTLINALESGRIPHAVLFTGIRGVGKTTLARLLAMSLNCVDGPTPTPCGTCDSCVEIRAGRHPDVLEIDAASRTKVDQMRDVLDMVRYAPTASRFKVYILDEVHMLTTQSFNALLKTLEEPPEHVKFIFATTESRRIPATILSRCQRHDLKRVPRDILSERLTHILNAEQVTFDPPGLAAVVQAADGSVRDALSVLDQAIAHGQGQVRFEDVKELLGLTDLAAVGRLLESLMAGDGQGVLMRLADFHQAGAEPAALVNDLLALLHQGARRRVLGPEAENSAQEASAFLDQRSQEHLQMVYQALLRGRADIEAADASFQALEMLMLRIAFLQPVPDLGAIVERLSGIRDVVSDSPPDSNPMGEGGVSGGGSPRPAVGASGSAGQDPTAGLAQAVGAVAPGQESCSDAGRMVEDSAPPDDSGSMTRQRQPVGIQGEDSPSLTVESGGAADSSLSGSGDALSPGEAGGPRTPTSDVPATLDVDAPLDVSDSGIAVSGEEERREPAAPRTEELSPAPVDRESAGFSASNEDSVPERLSEGIAERSVEKGARRGLDDRPEGAEGDIAPAEASEVRNPSGSLASWRDLLEAVRREKPSLGRKLKSQTACVDYQTDAEGRPTAIVLRLAHAVFQEPEVFQRQILDFLGRRGMRGARVAVEAASDADRPETESETSDRLQIEHTARVENAARNHPTVRKLADRFQGRIEAVEPSGARPE